MLSKNKAKLARIADSVNQSKRYYCRVCLGPLKEQKMNVWDSEEDTVLHLDFIGTLYYCESCDKWTRVKQRLNYYGS